MNIFITAFSESSIYRQYMIGFSINMCTQSLVSYYIQVKTYPDCFSVRRTTGLPR